jgi:hypothetical protein
MRELITNIQNTGERYRRWMEEQSTPTPIRRRKLFYSFKVPWELDHRCRGKGKRLIIEMHYESEN